ncbi:MAG: hypothetical protein A7315_07705 [Candidatus Altiarchaeales archaeon WOR_SM1_79]|nr:MAG: hypothetical protein A7315_07705 [Candidatus Altiarchaeales archaeon WOR_SM1_79]
MEDHELTEEERDQMLDQAFKKMNIKRRHLSRQELEKEIINYLSKKKPCSLATCGMDGVPRISVVDYINEGLTIYIFSEGGEKFKNIKENNKVAIGMGTGSKAAKTRGVNIWGIAEVFTKDTPEFAHGMKLFSPILKDMQQAIGGAPIEVPKGMRMIRVTPTKMVYCHNSKGISNAHWKAE